MKTFLSIMEYLRDELRHEELFVGKRHTRYQKMVIRRALRQLY